MIEEGLSYDEEQGYWVARYPFMFPRELLKGSRDIAQKSMVATEKMLCKRGNWDQCIRARWKICWYEESFAEFLWKN